MWKQRVHKIYESFEELVKYDEYFNIAARLGYSSVENLWKENPMIQGSTDSKDFRLAPPPSPKHCQNCGKEMSRYKFKKGKGLCDSCIETIN